MNLKEKIDKILSDYNLEQKQLAEKLQLNHMVFNRNLSKNRITGDLVNAFAEHFPEINLNWLVKDEPKLDMVGEDSEKYQLDSTQKLKQAMELIRQVKEEMTRDGHV
jgi:hypothetical protein